MKNHLPAKANKIQPKTIYQQKLAKFKQKLPKNNKYQTRKFQK